MPSRNVGFVAIALGAVVLYLVIETAVGTHTTWIDWATGPAIAVVGLGLLLSQRWAWALAILGGLALVVLGIQSALTAGLFGLVLYSVLWVPGALLVGALLGPRTLRWALKRPRAA
jgi:hypothetical protein